MSEVLREMVRDADRARIPLAAILELTRRCNLACPHCYAVRQDERAELSRAELCRLVRELRDLGSLFLSLSGGEATVCPDFLDVARAAGDLHMAVQIFTNGFLLDEKMADVLSDLSVFHVGISLYGVSAEAHDAITRRSGSFERATRAARALTERGIYACFRYIAMHANASEAGSAVAWAADQAIPLRVITQLTPRDNFSPDPQDLMCGMEDREALLRDQDPVRHAPYPVDVEAGRDLGCPMGKTLVAINAYGDVTPCASMPLCVGNIRQTPLHEIWREAPKLRDIRAFPRLERMPACVGCEFRAYCRRCPGCAYTETGNPHAPSPTACEDAWLRRTIHEASRPCGLPAGLLGVRKEGARGFPCAVSGREETHSIW